jgi:uncharacterized protein
VAFATLMIIAAIAMIRRTRQRSEPAPETSSCTKPPVTAPSAQSAVLVTTKPSSVATTIKLVASALGVGFLTGFLGVGGGFLIVPALVLALGYSMPIAVGTSLVIISIASAGAFAERLGSSTIPWQIVVPFTVAAIAGSFGGKAISDRVSANTLTRGLAALMIVVAAYMYTRVGLAAFQ